MTVYLSQNFWFYFISIGCTLVLLFSKFCLFIYLFIYFWAFVRFPVFVEFLLCKMTFSIQSHFFQTAIDSQKILHLTLGLVPIYSAAPSKWFIIKCLYIIWNLSFRLHLKSTNLTSYSTLTAYFLTKSLLASEDQPYHYDLSVFFFFFFFFFLILHILKRIFAETNLWCEDTPSKEKYTS